MVIIGELCLALADCGYHWRTIPGTGRPWIPLENYAWHWQSVLWIPWENNVWHWDTVDTIAELCLARADCTVDTMKELCLALTDCTVDTMEELSGIGRPYDPLVNYG